MIVAVGCFPSSEMSRRLLKQDAVDGQMKGATALQAQDTKTSSYPTEFFSLYRIYHCRLTFFFHVRWLDYNVVVSAFGGCKKRRGGRGCGC